MMEQFTLAKQKRKKKKHSDNEQKKKTKHQQKQHTICSLLIERNVVTNDGMENDTNI